MNLVRDRTWLESFLFAVALAVGLTPELLPMVVSVTLARGATRMARKKVLVTRLAAIHDLGSVDILCTDKTGTLTEARVDLDQHLDASGEPSARVLELAVLNSHFESGLKSPLDQAILRHQEVERLGWEMLDEVPFDFHRRRISVLLRRGDTRLLVVKGALEEILGLSTRYEANGPADVRPLDQAARRAMADRLMALGRGGHRVLGVAWGVNVASTITVTPASRHSAAIGTSGITFSVGLVSTSMMSPAGFWESALRSAFSSDRCSRTVRTLRSLRRPSR